MFLVHVDFPDSHGMIGTASCKKLDVRRKQEPREVVFVSFEDTTGQEGGGIVVLIHAPDVDVALITKGLVATVLVYQSTAEHTRLFPATRREPSLATLTLAIETSSTGTS